MREMRQVVQAADSNWWAEQLMRDALISRFAFKRGERATA